MESNCGAKYLLKEMVTNQMTKCVMVEIGGNNLGGQIIAKEE